MGWVRAMSPAFDSIADGALWAATEEGGLSRIKDGRVTTLTSRNGLPCDTIHWTIEDDDRSLWLYTACGLVRIARSELDAWIADPQRRIETTVWDAADGVRLHPVAPAYFGPTVAKSTDGKLWFLTGEGVQVVDPHHLPVNKIPPPVYIEQVTADGQTYDASQGLRLPAGVRDLLFDFTALSLGGVGEGALPREAGGPGQGLAGVGQPASSSLHEPAAGQLPLPRDGLRTTAACGTRKARLLDFSIAAGLLPDELVPRALRRRSSWPCSGRVINSVSGNSRTSST